MRGILVSFNAFNRSFLTQLDKRTKTTIIRNHRDTTYQLFKGSTKPMIMTKPQGSFL